MSDLQDHLDKVMRDQNHRPVPDFEGYSPVEMHQILHFPFGAESPIKIQKLRDADYDRIPMLNQIKYLLNLMDQSGHLNLTKKGYLPTKVVSGLYNQGFIKDELIEKGISKLYKETDSNIIHLTKILIDISGLVKKRHGKMSLTKSSAKMISDNDELLRLILSTFAEKFNWAYFDGYGENKIGQLGVGFSLILLSKYGNEQRSESFYAEKYFKAYPFLLNSIYPSYGTIESYSTRCYSLRTYERFLKYFGLIEIEEREKFPDNVRFITKTDLYDKLITCRPHQGHN